MTVFLAANRLRVPFLSKTTCQANPLDMIDLKFEISRYGWIGF